MKTNRHWKVVYRFDCIASFETMKDAVLAAAEEPDFVALTVLYVDDEKFAAYYLRRFKEIVPPLVEYCRRPCE